MNKIAAQFKVNTPMFLGSANNKTTAELRGASIRGALRFWWRALNWSRILDVETMHREESLLFGSSNQEIGQGIFLLSIPSSNITTDKKDSGTFANGFKYLAYGPVARGRLVRPYIDHGGTFTVEFYIKPGHTELLREQTLQLKDAIKALGLFGGLGSRVRRGLGSLTLLELRDDKKVVYRRPTSFDAYKKEAQELLEASTKNTELPPFSAFSGLMSLSKIEDGSEPISLLNSVGQKMNHYRSYRGGRNFKNDCWLFHSVARGNKTPGAHPQRVMFGMPHNYYSKKERNTMRCFPERHHRRASPLMLHVHSYDDNNVAMMGLIMKSMFLSDNMEKIVLKSGPNAPSVKAKIDYAVLTNFINSSSFTSLEVIR